MDEIRELLRQLQDERPAEWDQLPEFALYMDQVLSYMDRQVLSFRQEDELTASMVNNYTKSGLLPRADGKKYGREHLAYLTAICTLKHVMSSRDLDFLIREQLAQDRSVGEAYGAFRSSLDSALRTAAEDAAAYAEPSRYADAAFHFALLSYAMGLASNRYVALLRREKKTTPPDEAQSKEKNENA